MGYMTEGISNGDRTYKMLGQTDNFVGKSNDLPNPSKSITKNIGELNDKYKELKSMQISGTTSSSAFSDSLGSNKVFVAYKNTNAVSAIGLPYYLTNGNLYVSMRDATNLSALTNKAYSGIVYYYDL